MQFPKWMLLAAIALVIAVVQGFKTTMPSKPAAEVRVKLRPSIPLDPLNILTMADYDLQLCLYRTWFEYDSGRKAKPGIISKWKFDDRKGTYKFFIDEHARWSDGSPITSRHLIDNLLRAASLKTTYGDAINGIVDLASIEILDDDAFELKTRSGRPSEQFFQRMGSAFLAPVHPQDWDAQKKVVRNALTSGAYKLALVSEAELVLESNPYFKDLPGRALKVRIRIAPYSELVDFIEGKDWANVTQTLTLMPLALAKAVKAKSLPYWTRGHDRVSIIKPLGSGAHLEERRGILRSFRDLWIKHPVGELSFGSAKAKSLQPIGYPLFQEIEIAADCATKKNCGLKRNVNIIIRGGPSADLQMPIVEQVFQSLGMQVNWTIADSYPSLEKAIAENAEIDLAISNFGVADPEPATWMGLVLGNGNFIDVNAQDRNEYEAIVKHPSKELEIREFKKLLIKIAERGSYVPLFHFSTLSLARPGISFENIEELDETVNYSKLVFK